MYCSFYLLVFFFLFFFFFFNDPATTEIYTYCHTLSLHDALPIFFDVTKHVLDHSASGTIIRDFDVTRVQDTSSVADDILNALSNVLCPLQLYAKAFVLTRRKGLITGQIGRAHV